MTKQASYLCLARWLLFCLNSYQVAKYAAFAIHGQKATAIEIITILSLIQKSLALPIPDIAYLLGMVAHMGIHLWSVTVHRSYTGHVLAWRQSNGSFMKGLHWHLKHFLSGI